MNTFNFLDGDSITNRKLSDDICTSEEALIEHVFNINQMKRSNNNF